MLAFLLINYVVYLADSKPYPFIRRFKVDGKMIKSNDFEIQQGPFGKHIYLTSHAVYLQWVHQICSFTLATVLYLSDPPHTPALGFLTYLLRVTAFMAPICANLSICVCVLYIGLVRGARTLQADSFFLWKKYGYAFYEVDMVLHILVLPVALLDMMLLRPFYSHHVYVLYTLQDTFNFHVFLAFAVPIYYIGFMLVNFNLTKVFPYDVIYNVHSKGWLKGWLPFGLIMCCFGMVLTLLMTFAMPDNLYIKAF
jgi:hypothetical protein